MSADNNAADDGAGLHNDVIAMAAAFGNTLVKPAGPCPNRCMNRELVNQICADLPGAEVSDPWGGGHDAWKVGGKMFTCVGAMGDGVSLKTPDIETATMLIDVGRAIKAPYFHRSWIKITWDMELSDGELHDRILDSYKIIRSGLTKKFVATLDPIPE